MNCLRATCTSIGNIPSCIGTTCTSCWRTPDDRYENNIDRQYLPTLKNYALAIRISGFAFIAIEIAGFALLSFAFKSPPPLHMLTGLYVCVGGLVALPVALMIISHKQDAFCKLNGIDPLKLYKPPPKKDDGDDE